MTRPAPPRAGAADTAGTAELAVRDDARLAQLRALSNLLDSALRVPGTSIRVGLDPLLGLIPGVGDALGTVFSGYIILQAARLGASRTTLVRMLMNVGIDTLIGSVPFVGDLFDFGWRANSRNLALIERQLVEPARVRRASRLVVWGAVAVMALLVAGLLVGVGWLLVHAGAILAHTFGVRA